MIDFGLLTAATGGAASAIGATGIAAEIGAAATAGAFQGAALTEGRVGDRLKSAALGAVAAPLGAAAGKLAGVVAESVAGGAASKVTSAALGAFAGGTVGAGVAEADSLWHTGQSASTKDLIFAAGVGAAGGALAARGARASADALPSDRSAELPLYKRVQSEFPDAQGASPTYARDLAVRADQSGFSSSTEFALSRMSHPADIQEFVAKYAKSNRGPALEHLRTAVDKGIAPESTRRVWLHAIDLENWLKSVLPTAARVSGGPSK